MLTTGMKILNNELYIGSFKASELALKYHTPLFVYDEEHIRKKLDIFKNSFKSTKFKTQVIYASKAFFCPRLANIIDDYDMGIDSVSLGDMYQIINSSFKKERIVLHGNNKTDEEIEYAVNNNIGYIVIDNENEINKIEKIAKSHGKQVNVLLRVNPGISAHTHEYIQTSLLSSKFGESIYDKKKIDSIIKKCDKSNNLNLLGFHCHIGSNINNPKYFTKACLVMLDFICETNKRTNQEFQVLNLGGGFGVKYQNSDKEIDLEKILKSIIKTIESYIKKNSLKLDTVMIEPGRSIVGDSGSTIYQVGNIKKTYGGKNYVFVDGGMTDNIRPALYQASYEADIVNKMNRNEMFISDIVGPCCESGDIVVADYEISKPSIGEYLITYSTGAYGYSMSSNYNGRLRGNVIFVNKDEVNVGIKKEELSDLMKNFVFTNRIFDCHSDMLYDLWINKTKKVNNRFKDYHLPQLKKSVIKGSIFTMYSPTDFDLIEACEIALKEIDLNGLNDFKVILGLEGLRNLKSVDDIQTLYNMGFRHAMLTWNEENKYATGAKGTEDRGLTEEGIKLVKKMEELGMIIDLAHTNEKTFYDILKVANKKIIYSHGNTKSLCNHIRNVSDEQMKALKGVDGLLGLTLASNFVSSDKESQNLETFLKHVTHAIDIMGIDNVCFGFDFMDYLSDFPNSNLSEVSNATLAYRIIDGLKQIGLTDCEIDKITYTNFYNRYKDLVVINKK